MTETEPVVGTAGNMQTCAWCFSAVQALRAATGDQLAMTTCVLHASAPSVEQAKSPPDCFVVVVLRSVAEGIPAAEAVALSAEWEAHDVATMALRLGKRAFFIDTSGDDGTPTIEEYHGD